MSKIRSRRIVATYVVYGRTMEIERIDWKYTTGLSFDVHDVGTGLCLTAESLDNEPSVEVVEDIVAQLAEGAEQGTLDRFFDGADEQIGEIVAAVKSHQPSAELAVIRRLVSAALASAAVVAPATRAEKTLVGLAMRFDRLDTLLSRGGALPRAWSASADGREGDGRG